MPLESGSSQKTISHNIGVERRAHPSMDPKQAEAIAYSKARGDAEERPYHHEVANANTGKYDRYDKNSKLLYSVPMSAEMVKKMRGDSALDEDKLNKICDAIGGLNARMDALEGLRKDADNSKDVAEEIAALLRAMMAFRKEGNEVRAKEIEKDIQRLERLQPGAMRR